MPTRAEVERLKSQWEADPCFDLWDIEGFEEHSEELKEYQAQKDAEWARQNEARKQAHADLLGVPLEIAEKISALESRSVSKQAAASRILVHYFKMAGIPMEGDLAAEIETVADLIVDSATDKAQAALLLSVNKQSG